MGVLHALRVAGFASADAIAARSELSLDVVESVLRVASGEGHATFRAGRVTGWSLTKAGRARGEELLAAELDRARARDAVHLHYERFLVLNPRFLALCTDWQLRAGDEPTVNDHSDPEYDADVVARLVDIDDAVRPLLDDLADALARFGRYRERLAAARRQVEAGEIDWFTRPVIDSYHTVWFELHEDLLATLGLQRTGERPR